MFLQGFKYVSTLERVASERSSIRTKVLSFVVNNSILDLVEFLGLPLLNYKTTILHYLSRQTRPTRKTRYRSRNKRFSEQYCVYKSNLSRQKERRTQRSIKYNPKHSHKKQISISYDYALRKYQNENIRIPA